MGCAAPRSDAWGFVRGGCDYVRSPAPRGDSPLLLDNCLILQFGRIGNMTNGLDAIIRKASSRSASP